MSYGTEFTSGSSCVFEEGTTMLTAHRIAPAVFDIHQTGDPTTVTVIMYLGVFVIIVTAGLCIIGNRLPRLRDLWKGDDEDQEVTHVIPASPLFVPGRQVRL